MSESLSSEAISYLRACMDYCDEKLSDQSFFGHNSLQVNALRVESMRDTSPRCGLKPEHGSEAWKKDILKRGWGIWIFSGGGASVLVIAISKNALVNIFFYAQRHGKGSGSTLTPS